ncbi:exported hypothetical protein [Frankia canadensis]|uniref:Uncharacterized protein n=1 Tax=Frankia canadensis TaxID=1836972 RepID=A0A2I2KKY4_9ACTN|nr:exported hypothetical protein [Frankia canadensis]SOU53587.1 exported hypothetical protein [Frankia canadensis]
MIMTTSSAWGRSVASLSAIAISGTLVAFGAAPTMAVAGTRPHSVATHPTRHSGHSPADNGDLADIALESIPAWLLTDKATRSSIGELVTFVGGLDLRTPAGKVPRTPAEFEQVIDNAARAFVLSPTAGKAAGTPLTRFAGEPAPGHPDGHADGKAPPTTTTPRRDIDENSVIGYLLDHGRTFLESPGVQDELATLLPGHTALLHQLPDLAESAARAALDQVHMSYGSIHDYAIRGLALSPETVRTLCGEVLSAPGRPGPAVDRPSRAQSAV